MNAEQMGNVVNDMLNSAASPPAPTGSDNLFFGLTLTGMVLGSIFVLIGTAFLVYAKKQGRLVTGLCGVALIAFTMIVTDTATIAVLGTLFTVLPIILPRVGIDI